MGESSRYDSDKFYWHRYQEFYERELSGVECRKVLEYGVLTGDSMRWLRQRFPAASLFGADILEDREGWPHDRGIRYYQVDQGSPRAMETMLDDIGRDIDLVFEDGSHLPEHQRNCLVATIPHIRGGGVYVLEDLHTSHPKHPLYRKSQSFLRERAGPLHILLFLEHLKATAAPLSSTLLDTVASASMFSASQIEQLHDRIGRIAIYRRATLPLICFACGNSAFDYRELRCKCGVELFADSDSMSAVLHVRESAKPHSPSGSRCASPGD
jgi:hypothetical protein